MPEVRNYTTRRGHQLLYVHKPCDVPVVTLENYTKWYNIYLVMPDGSIQDVPASVVLEVCDKYPDARWVDHLYHPRLLYRVAHHLNATTCERSIEVAIGRWILESMDRQEEVDRNFHDPALGE